MTFNHILTTSSSVFVLAVTILFKTCDGVDKKVRASSLYSGQQLPQRGMADSATMTTGGGPGTGHCVYNFEVWTPNQNVLERLRRLEERCDAVQTNVDSELKLLTSRVIGETTNLTHRIEKSLLEQKLADAQQDVIIGDLRLKLVDLRPSAVPLSDVWAGSAASRETISGAENGRSRTPTAGSGLLNKLQTPITDVNQLYDQVVILGQTILQVKHGVGDLKAEWLLMKRDLQEVRVEHIQLRTAQTSVKEDAARLKATLDIVKSESGRLKAQQDELISLGEKLKDRVSLESGGSSGHSSVGASGHESSNIADQLADLSFQVKHLDAELQNLRSQYDDVTRHVLNAALNIGSSSELSRDDVSKLIDKMSVLMNRTALNQWQLQVARQSASIPKDCDEVYQNYHQMTSGVYQVRPSGSPHPDGIYCEMINGSGWTVVQRRVDGTVSFQRPWNDYKHGFGGPYGEHWIGLETLHRITTQRSYRLRIDMWDWDGGRWYAEYDTFRIDSELNKYRIHVRGYRGNAGNSLSYHDEMAFSTFDSDNDHHMRNCAEENKSGWWYSGCITSNLNGFYHQSGWYMQQPTGVTVSTPSGGSVEGGEGSSAAGGPYPDGIVWFTLKENEFYSLKRVEMKIRLS